MKEWGGVNLAATTAFLFRDMALRWLRLCDCWITNIRLVLWERGEDSLLFFFRMVGFGVF